MARLAPWLTTMRTTSPRFAPIALRVRGTCMGEFAALGHRESERVGKAGRCILLSRTPRPVPSPVSCPAMRMVDTSSGLSPPVRLSPSPLKTARSENRRHALPPVPCVGRIHVRVFPAYARLGRPNRDQLTGVLVRQRCEQESVDDREYRCVSSDAERDRHNRGHREDWTTSQ